MNSEHEKYMRIALQQASRAFEQGEVPIGCVIVSNTTQTIIAKAYNQVETLQDPTAHAEILAITAACTYLGSKYLTDCTLYVTLEPCLMCLGAIFWAQLSQVVFGAYEAKYSAMHSIKLLLDKRISIVGGVLEQECSTLIQEFFRARRK
ncbi:MAG: nucleoside deaminase [Bacteroidia bacterium]|nr:nucleoside deaminase [Bacteroidia bacterium]MDW8301053.1 nucleoside deaminase [Bacteroidia bacterium]